MTEDADSERVVEEAARRRTFAIISHPDAGKTTLTEKLLLYAGAVAEAGSVTARRGRRAATSDWMELERRRGISVTSTVLRFEHEQIVFNLLDTPGHKDFSEDTLRVLAAVDSAVILIDAAARPEAAADPFERPPQRLGPALDRAPGDEQRGLGTVVPEPDVGLGVAGGDGADGRVGLAQGVGEAVHGATPTPIEAGAPVRFPSPVPQVPQKVRYGPKVAGAGSA